MAKYMVTGAMVQVRSLTVENKPAVVYAYRGAVVELTAAEGEHLVSVNLVEKLADVTDDPVVQAGFDASTLPVASVIPSKDADEAEWRAHAIRSGLSEHDANVASKEDLVAIFADGGLVTPEPEPEPEPAKAPAKAAPAKAAPAKATPSKS